MTDDLQAMGRAAKEGARALAVASGEQRTQALEVLVALLGERKQEILAANQLDLKEAKAGGMNAAMLDRLSLEGRLGDIANDVAAIAAYPDPIGEVFESRELPNGLHLSRQRTPIGVLGVIYESRPNVTIDAAALAIRTGNAVILRGGKESMCSNSALAAVVQAALQRADLPATAVQLVASPAREQVAEMLKLHHYIDMIIPRGGAGLHTFCRENSTIPVITGGVGVCHLYADETVAVEQVVPVIINAKVQRPTVCNALDTCLVHREVAPQLLPVLAQALVAEEVQLVGDANAVELLGQSVQLAKADDWNTEWLSLKLGLKVVDSLDEAIAHIQQHSTGHSDGILTQSAEHAQRFVDQVDSAAVYVNASTRFTDGAQFGLGAEVAVSTQKLHARGPMGVREITSYKWVVRGQNHIRQ